MKPVPGTHILNEFKAPLFLLENGLIYLFKYAA